MTERWNAFPPEELARRLVEVRVAMTAGDLDGIVVSVPENIYYLSGLDHWGFFACHLLIVPRDGDTVLICRAMERVTVENQVTNARFVGHADHEDIVDHARRVLTEAGLTDARLGLERREPLYRAAHRRRDPEGAPRRPLV